MGMCLEAPGQHAGELGGASLHTFSGTRWQEGLNEGDIEEKKENHPYPVWLSYFCSLEAGTGAEYHLSDNS